jgi:hypothetical protein
VMDRIINQVVRMLLKLVLRRGMRAARSRR